MYGIHELTWIIFDTLILYITINTFTIHFDMSIITVYYFLPLLIDNILYNNDI